MDLQKLLDLTEKILILRSNGEVDLTWAIMTLQGGATSGNWAHDGRPGKRGGSGRGGGFNRLRVATGTTSREDVKAISRRVRKKRKQLKDKGVLPTSGSDNKQSKDIKPKENIPTKTKPGSGKPVSEGLNLKKVPQKGIVGPPIRDTIDIIDSVHSDGNLPEIPVRIGSTSATGGHYKYNSVTGKPIEIMVSRKSPIPYNTTAHEIGHFIDGQAWGRANTPGGGDTPKDKRFVEKYQNLHRTMNDSRAIKALKEEVPKQKITKEYTIGSTGEKRSYTYSADSNYIRYLVSPKEQFARAYSQYITEKSGDTRLKADIDKVRSKKKEGGIYYHEQWDDDDFKPISRAFDDMFTELGWVEGE